MTLILSRNIHGHDTQMNLNKDTYGQLIGKVNMKEKEKLIKSVSI